MRRRSLKERINEQREPPDPRPVYRQFHLLWSQIKKPLEVPPLLCPFLGIKRAPCKSWVVNSPSESSFLSLSSPRQIEPGTLPPNSSTFFLSTRPERFFQESGSLLLHLNPICPPCFESDSELWPSTRVTFFCPTTRGMIGPFSGEITLAFLVAGYG